MSSSKRRSATVISFAWGRWCSEGTQRKSWCPGSSVPQRFGSTALGPAVVAVGERRCSEESRPQGLRCHLLVLEQGDTAQGDCRDDSLCWGRLSLFGGHGHWSLCPLCKAVGPPGKCPRGRGAQGCGPQAPARSQGRAEPSCGSHTGTQPLRDSEAPRPQVFMLFLILILMNKLSQSEVRQN